MRPRNLICIKSLALTYFILLYNIRDRRDDDAPLYSFLS